MTQGMKLRRQRAVKGTFCPTALLPPKAMDLMAVFENMSKAKSLYIHSSVYFSVCVSNKNLCVCVYVDHANVSDLKHIMSYLSAFIKAYLYVKAHT